MPDLIEVLAVPPPARPRRDPAAGVDRWIDVRILLAVVALLALLTACASDAPGRGGDATGTGSAGGISPTENDLAVEIDRGEGSAVEQYTLVCAGAVEGDHPDAQAACDHLTGLDDPFAQLPADVACTQVYDGPQTAHVSGRWAGEPVDLDLARSDGCLISQWDGLGPLLPESPG